MIRIKVFLLSMLLSCSAFAVQVPSQEEHDRLNNEIAALVELVSELEGRIAALEDTDTVDTGGSAELSLPDAVQVNLPSEPTTSRTVTVNTANEFNKATSVAGTRVIVGSNIDANAFVGADDIDIDLNGHTVRDLWLCETRKTCKGDWGSGQPVPVGEPVHRVRIHNGKLGSVFTMVPLGNVDRFNRDLIIEDVDINTHISPEETGLDLRGVRVLVRNSNVLAQEFAISGQKNDDNVRSQDVVIDNNVLSAFAYDVSGGDKNEATVRMTHGDGLVFIGNHVQNGTESTWSDTADDGTKSKHTFRVHGEHTQVYVADNVFYNSGSMLPDFGSSAGNIDKLWIVDNVTYMRGGRAVNINYSEGGTINRLTVTGNVEYKAGAEGWNYIRPRYLDYIESMGGSYSINGNTVHNWQSPDQWLPR